MDIWLLLDILWIALWSAQSETNNGTNEAYTYYLKTHRYSLNNGYHIHQNIDNDVIDINVLFRTNASSCVLNINHNISLDYDNDEDWNEIQSVRLRSSNRRRLYANAKRKGRFIGVTHARRYHDAERVCRHRYGGELASITTSNENKQVRSLCKSLSKKSNCWVGLRRPFRHWTDGAKVKYKHWQPGEPNNAGKRESCTEIYRNGRWNDNRCGKSRPFICETARTSKDGSYIAIGMALSWDNANEYCHRRFETELASARSDRSNRAIRRLCDRVARRGSCWIGLERPFKKWEDRKRVTYTHWNPGEPNNHGSGESCTEMYKNRRWNDLACRSQRFFVCNYKNIDNRSGKRKRSSRRRRRRRKKRGRRRSRWKRGRRKHRKVAKEANGRTLHMACARGRIETLVASYGKNCKRENYNNQLQTLRSKCNRKSRCRYRIDVNKIGDPSRGCSKEYEYTYRCKQRKRGRRGRRGRRRSTRRRRRRRSIRFRRWKCSRLKFGDYERKECLRRRSGTVRRGGRSKARSRWRKRLESWAARMKARGYKGFSGMGRGFRKGFEAGKRSVKGVKNIWNGGGNALGFLGASSSLGSPPLPQIKGKVPLPPRIQLIDLPSRGRGRGRRRRSQRRLQLGTGYNIGMTGHHHKYGMSPYLVEAALAQGATMDQLQHAAKDTHKLFNKEQKNEKKIAKNMLNEEGFGGFHGFDGFGDGRVLQNKNGNKKGKWGGKQRARLHGHPEALSFGIGEKRRRLLGNEIKCVVKGVYEICAGYDYVQVKQLVQVLPRVALPDTRNSDGSDKYQAMMKGDHVYENAHHIHDVEMYEFIYDGTTGTIGTQQCFDYLTQFVICLNISDENHMMFYIENEDNRYNFNFSNDNEWTEIDEIIVDNDATSIQKCVVLLKTKMCMHCENNSNFKMLIYRII